MFSILKFKQNFKDYWYYYLLGLAIIIFLTYQIFYFNVGYGWDESVYLKHIDIFLGQDASFNEFAFRPISISLILIPFYLISKNIAFLHIVMVLFFAISALILFFLYAKIFNKKVASVIVSLFLCSSWIITTAQFILTDLFVFLFIIPGIYFSYTYFTEKKYGSIVLASVFFALAFLTRFFCGSFILILIFLILLDFKFNWSLVKTTMFRLLILILTFGVVVAPYFIFVKQRFGSYLYTMKAGNLLVNLYDGQWYIYLKDFVIFWPFFVILFALGIYFLYKNIFSQKNKELEKFLIVFIVVFLLQFIYLAITPHKEPRYLIPLVLTISFIGAYGFSHLLNIFKTKTNLKQNIKNIAFYLFILASILVFFTILVFLINPPEKSHYDMGPINYLKEINYNGVIYTNTDVPQYFYLFDDRNVINLYYYALNNLDTNNLFYKNGILVYNEYRLFDINNLPPNVELDLIKDMSPYYIYSIKIN